MTEKREKPNPEREKVLQGLRDELARAQKLLAELEDTSYAKLRRVKKLVASVPEGAFLLKLAQKTGTRIYFSTQMKPGLAGVTKTTKMDVDIANDNHLHIIGKPHYKIVLDPLATVEEAAATLAHELRHLWQNTKLDKNRLVGNTPGLSLAHMRVAEGDARAFEAYFRMRLQEKKEGKAPKEVSPAKWKRAFIKYQKSPVSGIYDRDVLASAKDSLKTTAAIGDPKSRKKFLSTIFNANARKGLENAEKVLVAGFNKNARPYFPARDKEKLAKKLVGYAKPKTRARLRKMEKAIKGGLS